MRRDWRLIREILISMENHINLIEIDNMFMAEHLNMLNDIGYIDMRGNITWQGYNLLELLRDESVIERMEEQDLPITEDMIYRFLELERN